MPRFWIMHGAYTSLEMIKLLIGAIVTFSVARQPSLGTDDVRALERPLEVHRLEP